MAHWRHTAAFAGSCRSQAVLRHSSFIFRYFDLQNLIVQLVSGLVLLGYYVCVCVCVRACARARVRAYIQYAAMLRCGDAAVSWGSAAVALLLCCCGAVALRCYCCGAAMLLAMGGC